MNGPDSAYFTSPRRTSVGTFLAVARDQARALIQRAGFELVRKRRAQAAVAALVALVVSGLTGSMVSSARTHHRQWATSAPVLVAVVDLPAGTRLNRDNTSLVRLPPAATPRDVIATARRGSTLRIAVTARTPLTRSLVRTDGADIDVPRGWRTVAMPQDIATPRLHPGDSVDVVAGDRVVATGGIVASVGPVTVAVPAGVAPLVAAAARMGEISLIAGG